MPYKNILWTKLEHRLLNDSRFFLLPEKAQLIYIKMLMIAAQTDNKITADIHTLKALLRTKLRVNEIQKCLKLIQFNFPKFKKNPKSPTHYYFEEWDTRVNWVSPRNSKGNPKELPGTPRVGADKEEDKYKEEEQNFIFNRNTKAPTNVKLSYLGNDMVWKNSEKQWYVIENGQWMKWSGNNEDEKKIICELKR